MEAIALYDDPLSTILKSISWKEKAFDIFQGDRKAIVEILPPEIKTKPQTGQTCNFQCQLWFLFNEVMCINTCKNGF